LSPLKACRDAASLLDLGDLEHEVAEHQAAVDGLLGMELESHTDAAPVVESSPATALRDLLSGPAQGTGQAVPNAGTPALTATSPTVVVAEKPTAETPAAPTPPASAPAPSKDATDALLDLLASVRMEPAVAQPKPLPVPKPIAATGRTAPHHAVHPHHDRASVHGAAPSHANASRDEPLAPPGPSREEDLARLVETRLAALKRAAMLQ
jgi:hypothetical protein